MTTPHRFDPSRPLTGHQVGKIRNARPEDRRHYRTIARDAACNVAIGELSDYYYSDSPFEGSDSELADACWVEALHRRWLTLTGQPLREIPATPAGWEQSRIDRLKLRVKALHAGNKIAHMIGCVDMTVYQVLGDSQYYRPGKRAEWLGKIEGAVNDIEGFRVYVKRMIERESDRRTA
jgi:hypothetical protein